MARDEDTLIDTASSLVERLRKLGADHAEVSAQSGWELSTRVRLGMIEQVEEAGHRHVSLRVIRDARVAITSTSDMSPSGLDRAVSDAMDLLSLSEPDPDAAPAEPRQLAHGPWADLETYDPTVEGIDATTAIDMATRAEQAALESDGRLNNSEGATFGRAVGESAMVLSTGFVGMRRGSHVSLVVTPVADDAGEKKRRGCYYSVARFLADLETPIEIGREAARRTLAQLGARSVPTCEASVVFSVDGARAIVGAFAGCAVGGAIFRRSSYLVGREGTQVASPIVTFVDDPLLRRGLGSRVFDGEGLGCRKLLVVDKGQYQGPLLDCLSARKLKRESTGSASRHGGAISATTSNFVMDPGQGSEEALIASTRRGLLVTEMMGFGFNPVTGDFSRGASGFWLEDGRQAFPVSEVTISSNLDTMLKGIDAIAETPRLSSSIIAPAFRVSCMTVAGKQA
jgi:PmbA protein